MKVNWKIAADKSPIIFNKQAEWCGLRINHYRLVPGDLIEQSSAEHEITITLNGCLTTRKQKSGSLQTSRGRSGNLCLTPAGARVAAFWTEEMECLLLDIKPALLVQSALENELSPRIELSETYQTSDSLIQNIALNLLNEFNSAEAVGKLYSESLMQTLVFHLLKNYNVGTQIREDSRVGLSGLKLRRAKEFIHDHLTDDFTLGELAAAVGLSQFHFARAFRRSIGLTPQQYLMQQRLKLAKQLLANGELPLVEVGARSGFKSQSHFTTLFRRLTGHTPRAFREGKRGKTVVSFEHFE